MKTMQQWIYSNKIKNYNKTRIKINMNNYQNKISLSDLIINLTIINKIIYFIYKFVYVSILTFIKFK
jgi:hypothetical protein